MAGAHDPGDPGLYSSPDLQVEIRFPERYLYSLASAVASLVTDSTSSARGLASMRHRLSGGAYTNLKQFSAVERGVPASASMARTHHHADEKGNQQRPQDRLE